MPVYLMSFGKESFSFEARELRVSFRMTEAQCSHIRAPKRVRQEVHRCFQSENLSLQEPGTYLKRL